MASSGKDIAINTLIGAGTMVKGDLNVSGFVRIDGDLDGNLDASGRIITGENSRIRGDISGQFITVGGVVEGDIIASEGVHILSSALVIGDIITKRLYVADSVLLHGYCFAVDNQEKFEEACFTRNNRKTLRRGNAAR